jgi:presenilin-like A22 family membrane protease
MQAKAARTRGESEIFRRSFIILFYILAGSLTLWVALRPEPFPTVGLGDAGVWRISIILVVAFSLAVVLLSKIRSRIFWEGIFALTMFLGVWYAFLLLLPVGWALLVASSMVLLQAFADRIWTHDLFYLFGSVGLALSLAGWLMPEAVLVGLVGLVTYDIVAAPPRRPILDLASRLVRQGIVPGLIVPGRGHSLLMRVADGIRLPDAALLGAGDLAVPLIVVAEASRSGLLSGLAVLLGLACGAWLLGLNPGLAPRPALQFLALGAGIPFCILYIFGFI